MTAADLLVELRGRGVGLEARDGRLRVDAPVGVLTDADKALLLERKGELLRLLVTGANTQSEATTTPPPLLSPTAHQAEAVRRILEWYRGGPRTPQEFYIAGFAGTGKTTVARIAVEELAEKCGATYPVVAAYTGKAANVLRRKGLHGAMTIHSMIYVPVEDEDGNVTFMLAPDAPAGHADIIVLDEVSMVDDEIAADVRSYGRKILVIGDPGQLPPIRGQGAFTRRQPDFLLTEIHRQAADSPIIRLATMARLGQPIPPGDYGDDVVVQVLSPETMQEVHREETQVICGLHRTRWATTQQIRERLCFGGRVPDKGERLICKKNDKTLAIFNGQQGDLLVTPELDEDGRLIMDVKMDDLAKPLKDLVVRPYLFAQHFDGPSQRPRMERGVQEFDWGYVLTVHSAQGSEWPHVTVIDDSAAFKGDRRKHLYTAITRASSGLRLLQRSASVGPRHTPRPIQPADEPIQPVDETRPPANSASAPGQGDIAAVDYRRTPCLGCGGDGDKHRSNVERGDNFCAANEAAARRLSGPTANYPCAGCGRPFERAALELRHDGFWCSGCFAARSVRL